MTQPTFEEALQQAISKSPARIVVQPYLLYPGRLLQQIHARLAELSRQIPHIEWVSAGALGPDVRLVDCVLDFAIQATEGSFSRQVV
jgi:sirohydrochlorin ferrochelatase